MKKLFAICVCALLLVQISCKKDKDEEPQPIETNEGLDPMLTNDEAAVLDSIPETSRTLDDIFYENGQSVRDFLEQNDIDFLNEFPSDRVEALTRAPRFQKDLFIGRMTAVGLFLCNRPARKADMAAPQQENGLAYSYGSKQYQQRKAPNAGVCTDPVYGLDCSGMMYNMGFKSGLDKLLDGQDKDVAHLAVEENWNKAFRQSVKYTSLRMINKGHLDLALLEFGDLVVYPKHIGFYIGNGEILQSNGQGDDPADCAENLTTRRGPRVIGIPANSWLGNNYNVLRVADNSTAIFSGAPGVFGNVKFFVITDDGTQWPAAIAGANPVPGLSYYAIGFSPTDTFGNHRISMQIYVPSLNVGSYPFGTVEAPTCYIITGETGATQWGTIYLTPPEYQEFNSGIVYIDEKKVEGDGKTYIYGSYSGNITFMDQTIIPPAVSVGAVSGDFTALVQ